MAKQKKLFVTSNAHLDTQWNWTIQDTIRDCVKNTLVQNFELFEKYPHYRMNFEGAFRYKLAKEYYPDLYEILKGYVAQGRWNVAGSQWDASDANVPSSEAYMRQILLGNGFFEKEFGKKSSDIFLTDCFGFRYSLPSIAAHMGLNGFSTQKLVWGVGSPIYNPDKTTRKPMPEKGVPRMDLGKWVGPDGNYVIASFLGGNYTLHFERDEQKRPIHDREEYLKQIEHNEEYTGVPSRMIYYGTGDYGGSPSDESVRYLNEAVEANSPDKAFEVISASTDDIFNSLTKEEIDALPVYDGSLNIPHGFGAMTSHTISKRWNRKCELLADSCERAASMAKWLGKAAYPKAKMDEAWKLFLWHQFHDDLPGTSILDAYHFTHNDYVIAQNMMAEELSASVDALSGALNTNVSGTPYIVYNPVSVYRSDIATAKLPKGSSYARVYDCDGNEVPSQISKVDGKKVIKFVASVAPVSFTVYNICADTSACTLDTGLYVGLNVLENSRYKVTLNDNADIASIYDKKNDRELLSAPSSLGIREDNNTVWPSWEIKYDDTKLPFETVKGLTSVRIVDRGPAIVSLLVTKEENGSKYRQTISLVAGSDRVDVDNNIDWHERRSLLSAGFPLTVSNEKATFDLGLGAEEGGNTDSFPYFQHCVHQWADLTDSDGSFGVAILNDCKYGMEKPNDSTLRLTLIHTPLGAFMSKSAEDWQDHGKNLFRYSIVSHKGERAGIAAEAAAFNQPLFTFKSTKHEGEYTNISMLSLNTNEVIVRAVKEEEKGERLIVRVQETSGKEIKNVKLTLSPEIISAFETNGYEEEPKSVCYDSHSLSFDMTPYSVKTFAIETKNSTLEAPYCKTVALDYNTRVTTPDSDRTLGELGKGISIPEELFEKNVRTGNLTFELGNKGENNAVICEGQTVALPEGAKKVAVLACCRKRGDKNATFKSGERETAVTVQNFSDYVGKWDLIARGDAAMIKRDPIAINYTHTHDEKGNRLYLFANIFKYVIDVEGESTLTLPEDSDIAVLAVSAFDDNGTATVTPLYDVAEPNKNASHKLTFNMNGSVTVKKIPEGNNVILNAEEISSSGVFSHFEGDADIVWSDYRIAMVEMGDKDVELTAVYKDFGENVVYNKPFKANGATFDSEAGDKALNGKCDSKWCSPASEDGSCWLEVDIGEVTPIYKWLVAHAGAEESKEWNTYDFSLQYKVNENDEWQTADDVKENTDNCTIREFTPVNARYVRLHITQPALPGKDNHCRIYQLHVYKCK